MSQEPSEAIQVALMHLRSTLLPTRSPVLSVAVSAALQMYQHRYTVIEQLREQLQTVSVYHAKAQYLLNTLAVGSGDPPHNSYMCQALCGHVNLRAKFYLQLYPRELWSTPHLLDIVGDMLTKQTQGMRKMLENWCEADTASNMPRDAHLTARTLSKKVEVAYTKRALFVLPRMARSIEAGVEADGPCSVSYTLLWLEHLQLCLLNGPMHVETMAWRNLPVLVSGGQAILQHPWHHAIWHERSNEHPQHQFSAQKALMCYIEEMWLVETLLRLPDVSHQVQILSLLIPEQTRRINSALAALHGPVEEEAADAVR